jgi:hypothetical protein
MNKEKREMSEKYIAMKSDEESKTVTKSDEVDLFEIPAAPAALLMLNKKFSEIALEDQETSFGSEESDTFGMSKDEVTDVWLYTPALSLVSEDTGSISVKKRKKRKRKKKVKDQGSEATASFQCYICKKVIYCVYEGHIKPKYRSCMLREEEYPQSKLHVVNDDEGGIPLIHVCSKRCGI